MQKKVEWQPWSAERIAESIPRLVEEVKSALQKPEVALHNDVRTAIEALAAFPPTPAQVSNRSREDVLTMLGAACEAMARNAARTGTSDESLSLFQAAHELFRGGNLSHEPNRAMRRSVQSALRVLARRDVECSPDGTVDASIIRKGLHELVISAWGSISPKLDLDIDELLLGELERLRVAQEDDREFIERLVRDNIETVLALELPRRLEQIRERWQDIGHHVAPAAVRLAKRAFRRPESLSKLVQKPVWAHIRQAVEHGSVDGLIRVLGEIEDVLEENLRLRLDAKVEYRKPESQLKLKGNIDPQFIEARGLLLKRDANSLGKFRDIHFRNSSHTAAKEWYAYALSELGQKTDVHDVIELLEDAIGSPYFLEDVGWPARWNLACALRGQSARAEEALKVLLPVLEIDRHPAEAFELCLLWAFEQDKDEVLRTLLPRAIFYEAHLLAVLYDYRALEKLDKVDLSSHFRRINRIMKDPDYVFPDPKENVGEQLDRLTREFIESSLISTGQEWIRQRLSYDSEVRFYKNWECAAKLNEAAGDLRAAWRCRERQWDCTRRGKVGAATKGKFLKWLCNWARRNNFHQEALGLLSKGWRDAGLNEADVRFIEETLKVGRQRTSESREPVGEARPVATIPAGRPVHGVTATDAERTIQELAPALSRLSSVSVLTSRMSDVKVLIAAVRFKHPGRAEAGLECLEKLAGVASRFNEGLDEVEGQRVAKELSGLLSELRTYREEMPYEAQGLAQACERIVQNCVARVGSVASLNITPPSALGCILDRPENTNYGTRLLARVTNPAPEAARDVVVTFMSDSPHLSFGTADVIPEIGSGQRVILGCPVDVGLGLLEGADVRVHVTCQIGGIQRSAHASGRVPVQVLPRSIPSTRYETHRPVSFDRVDLFHGREKELADLCGAFAGGRLRKLYFVNGIRRVGKSTLMVHLGKKYGPTTLALVLNVESALSGQRMSPTELVRELIRRIIKELHDRTELTSLELALPSRETIEQEPPWVFFEGFLEELRRKAGGRQLLLCFDEVQQLIKRIADDQDPMDHGFLSWLREKIQGGSDILITCSGSESYSMMRKRYEDHTVWGNMEPYNISFVDKSAMRKIASLPVEQDGVTWLQETIDRLWDMTEGHPWITQVLAEKIAERLNTERRRLVGPMDVDWAADVIAPDSRYRELWWNEKDGEVTETHRQIAFVVLQNQPGERLGIAESSLAEMCAKSGIRNLGKYLEEMRDLELVTEASGVDEPVWRIRGAFLERHLRILLHRAVEETGGRTAGLETTRPLALMFDWENAKLCLLEQLERIPAAKKTESMRGRVETGQLANRLLTAASHHGDLRQRWAVANWDRPVFQGDQKALRRANIQTDISGEDKDNASDHVLVEKIHWVLREHPEIDTFVIGTGDGDFGAVIGTLRGKGKHIVLWATREGVSRAYKHFLSGPDRIQIEWLEDLVFLEDAEENTHS